MLLAIFIPSTVKLLMLVSLSYVKRAEPPIGIQPRNFVTLHAWGPAQIYKNKVRIKLQRQNGTLQTSAGEPPRTPDGRRWTTRGRQFLAPYSGGRRVEDKF